MRYEVEKIKIILLLLISYFLLRSALQLDRLAQILTFLGGATADMTDILCILCGFSHCLHIALGC